MGFRKGDGYAWCKSHFHILAFEDVFQYISWPGIDFTTKQLGFLPEDKGIICIFSSLLEGDGGE